MATGFGARGNGTVHIVDDDGQVRRFLAEVMTSIGLDVEDYPSGDEFMRRYNGDRVGCVLLDIRMPRVTGPEVHDWLRSRHPNVPVIFLTGYADVPTAVRAMRHGAFDFLEKPFNVQQLIERVNEAMRLAAREDQNRKAQEDSGLASLTRRERDVLRGIVAGHRNKLIAAELGISERTVETHRANLMVKMKAQSVAELVTLTLAADPDLLTR